MHFVSTVEFRTTTWHHSPPPALNEAFYLARLVAAARVAKLADALDLGSCALNGVGVQLPPLAFFILFAMGESVLTLDNAEGK